MVAVIAHRGARSLAPENTLSAAEAAWETGADLWETDVQQSRDGHLVLFHDQTLERCTDVHVRFPSKAGAPLWEFTAGELAVLEAGSYFARTDPFGQVSKGRVPRDRLERYDKETIPTLAQGLRFTREKDWRINLELKHYPGQPRDKALPEKTLKTVFELEIPPDRVKISSFYHPWLDWVLAHYPGVDVQALLGDAHDPGLDFEDYRFDTYNINADRISPEQVMDLKLKNKKINLFTVNDPERFYAFSSLGVDGIITDFPQRFSRPV